MSDYKCIVCNRPILTTDDNYVIQSVKLETKLIGRCVSSSCIMSNLWLPIEVLEKFERLLFQRNNAYDELGWSRDIDIDEFTNKSDRVYCTADGEYPDFDQIVEFQTIDTFKKQGYFSEYGNVFRSFNGYVIAPSENDVIYWKPLISLKDEYERKKRGE